MPQILKDLQVDEISLVDFPANSSIDPKTGKKRRHAVVALWKRDNSGDDPQPRLHPVFNHQHITKLNRKETKEMSLNFESIMKSSTATRSEIVQAVEQRAEEIAKRDGVPKEYAEAWVWRHTNAAEAYERSPKLVGVFKTYSPVLAVTKAEGRLDIAARKIMKREPGVSYPAACTKAMSEDPSIYADYLQQSARQEFFVTSEENIAKAANAVGYDDQEDGEDCMTCGGSGKVKGGKTTCPVCEGTGIEPDDGQGDDLEKLDEVETLKARVAKLEARLTAAK